MAPTADVGPRTGLRSGQPSPAGWLAIRFLRQVVHRTQSLASTGNALETGVELACAEEAFCSFLAVARRDEDAREPRLAHPGSPLVTKDEWRMLRAFAAAQAGDEVLLDNYIYKLALGALPRAQLATVVRVLARALAAQEHGFAPGKAR